MYCRPVPIGPPMPSRNGVNIDFSAPPSGCSTMPVRTMAARVVGEAAAAASRSQSTHSRGEEVIARRGGLGDRLVAAGAVVADGAVGDQGALPDRCRGKSGGKAAGGEHAAGAKRPLARLVPSPVGNAFARQVHDDVRIVQGSGPGPDRAVRLPRDLVDDAWARAPREGADGMPVGREVGVERAAQKAGSTGKDDGHRWNCGQYITGSDVARSGEGASGAATSSLSRCLTDASSRAIN